MQAAAPNLVEPEDLGPANSLLGSAWGTMLAVGAALGGVVVAVLGRDAAFVIDSGSFLVSALLLWRIHRPFSEGAPRGAPRRGRGHEGDGSLRAARPSRARAARR